MKSQDAQTNRLVAFIKDHGFNAHVRVIEKEKGYFVEQLRAEAVYYITKVRLNIENGKQSLLILMKSEIG